MIILNYVTLLQQLLIMKHYCNIVKIIFATNMCIFDSISTVKLISSLITKNPIDTLTVYYLAVPLYYFPSQYSKVM